MTNDELDKAVRRITGGNYRIGPNAVRARLSGEGIKVGIGIGYSLIIPQEDRMFSTVCRLGSKTEGKRGNAQNRSRWLGAQSLR